MDYNALLHGCCELGCRLLSCGGEIYRVEDTVRRVCAAYGVDSEVFAIPNCLIVSVTDLQGRIYTRMRRAEVQSTNIEALEQYNALSRRVCANPPQDPREIVSCAQRVGRQVACYPIAVQLLGYFLGAFFFGFFFSGGWVEAVAAGLSGLTAGACVLLLSHTRSNFFINTMLAGFVLAFTAYGLLALRVPVNIQVVITGSIMTLVPGLVFTNFMSNLLTGEIVAGLSTFVRAVLTAGAIALGTGAAIAVCEGMWNLTAGNADLIAYSPVLCCVLSFFACLGFCFPYNVQGLGAILCCLGGALGWAVYLSGSAAGLGVYVPYLLASMVVAVYSELMARVRKCPATSYLLISYFPLVPGFTIYQAMDYGIRGNISAFIETFLRTFGIAGCIALGTLFISTLLRIAQRRRVR